MAQTAKGMRLQPQTLAAFDACILKAETEMGGELPKKSLINRLEATRRALYATAK